MATTSARRLTSCSSAPVGWSSAIWCGAGQGEVSEDVVLALIHQRGQFGPARWELIGDMPPDLMRGLGIGLQKSLADRGGAHRAGLLARRPGVAHPMHAARAGTRTTIAGRHKSAPSK